MDESLARLVVVVVLNDAAESSWKCERGEEKMNDKTMSIMSLLINIEDHLLDGSLVNDRLL